MSAESSSSKRHHHQSYSNSAATISTPTFGSIIYSSSIITAICVLLQCYVITNNDLSTSDISSVQARLNTHHLGRHIQYTPSCESTMVTAINEIHALDVSDGGGANNNALHGTVYLTDEQTKGVSLCYYSPYSLIIS